MRTNEVDGTPISEPALDPKRKCVRCKETFGNRDRCAHCGVHKDRRVQKVRRRKIGGKRGRNSGKVNQHGKKK